jgi:undecaprenyl-diphosphatase
MLETLKTIDTSLFLAINGAHNDFFDILMPWISERWIWIPFYIFLAWLLYRDYGHKVWILLILGGLAIVITDQTSVYLFKHVFHRLRPCHEPALEGVIHLVDGKCGGKYGFISSHAANTFGLATYLAFLLGKKIRFFTPVILLWAAMISYSRIYLGVHYPGDIIVGGIWGAGIGAALYILFNQIDTIVHNKKHIESFPD